MNSKVGVIGLGVVGNALHQVFKEKKVNVIGYDKYKNGGIGNINDCVKCDIIFLCLPTPFSQEKKDYDLDAVNDVVYNLNLLNYQGLIVNKSTVNPGTTEGLSNSYPNINFIHNPEFLTARNAQVDFLNQNQIVLGKTKNCDNELFNLVVDFYKLYWPNSIISICSSGESEIMKLGCNTFYSVKIQYFTELYILCKKNNFDFELVKNMMILNNGISPKYTNVPGHDGSISYSGMCFPKDTNALNSFMQKNNLPNLVLDSTIKERNLMRSHDNDLENNNL